MQERMWRKGNPSALLVGCRLVQPLWKAVWRYLQKLKMDLIIDTVIPLLGLYPKNPETPIQRNLCTPMFIAALFTIANIWKQPKCPSVNEWIKKKWYIYTMEYYAVEKGTPTLHDHMDGTGEYYAKWNKSVGERQIYLTCKRNLMNKRN